MNAPITRRHFLQESLTFAGLTMVVTATPPREDGLGGRDHHGIERGAYGESRVGERRGLLGELL
jgi:hypothetical protein